jgi:hypothetical protein
LGHDFLAHPMPSYLRCCLIGLFAESG